MTTHRTPSIPPSPPRRLRTTAGGHQQAPPHTRPGRIARARHAIQQLAPETIEQIALRVVQLLQQAPFAGAQETTAAGEQPAGLLTAAQLAERLGVSRAWVYQHARRLGAITLGDGPKARLRFDMETATEALRGDDRTEERALGSAQQKPRSRPHPSPLDMAGSPLIPINRPGVRGILSAWNRIRRQREH